MLARNIRGVPLTALTTPSQECREHAASREIVPDGRADTGAMDAARPADSATTGLIDPRGPLPVGSDGVTRARLWWARLLYTLWFVPAAMVVGSAILAVALIEVSGRVDAEVLARWPRVFGASSGSSREMLAAIAGSMITVAGVTFSITMIAVTQASTQYTPRILRNFMRDRPSQVVLGGLSGVFTYCLIVLRTIRGGDDSGFVPSIAVLGGFVFAGVGVGLLIYFVHHISSSLQASAIIERVASDTRRAIDGLFPSAIGEAADPVVLPTGLRLLDTLRWEPVLATATGYVQHVDAEGMLAAAVECGAVVRMERGIGEFVAEDTPLASVVRLDPARPGRLDAKVRSMYAIGPYRTVEQDPDFGIRQLSDIALKALSPGINDPTTALTCIDHLGAVLTRAASRQGESPWRECEGEVRVVARGPTFESLVSAGFDEIRRHGESHAAVLFRQLDTLAAIANATRNASRRRHLLVHVDLIAEASQRAVPAPADRGALDIRAAQVRAMLEVPPGP